MSETKWTKQDWLIDRVTVYALNAEGTTRFTARVEGGWTTHGRTRTEMQEREANASLIAASPELYEALEHCEHLLMRYEINRVGGGAIADEALTKIRAALAKARGES